MVHHPLEVISSAFEQEIIHSSYVAIPNLLVQM